MEIGFVLLTIIGLSVFEIITSIDNAIINAEVLSTVSQKTRKWFLSWGLFFSVFLVRGLLPLLIVLFATPNLGVTQAITSVFSSNPGVKEAIEKSSPLLLIGGGTFLVFLFFHWLFLEPKNYGLKGERFFHKQGVWFFAVASLLLTAIVWFALQKDPFLAFGAVVGSSAFFIIHGFREYAEETEKKLMKGKMTDVSKIIYLEILDATFSIDGVIGAFAFTFYVPLILLGNGLGAIVLRQMTVSNISRIKKYLYLKNGAMYSILFLGSIMVLDSFGLHIPEYVSPIITVGTVGYFFLKSRFELKKSLV